MRGDIEEKRWLDQLQLHDLKLSVIAANDVHPGIGRVRGGSGKSGPGELDGALRRFRRLGFAAEVRLDAKIA